ncbi:MAG TPA: glycosyltransferase family 4 protein [Syntrophomonas sp.]|nr:glycosyltransferase family 4 protein [Syntrophomonas sp.]HRW11541.1 glycosyltransferase family 4 protein [Syntrophomonas sp.]
MNIINIGTYLPKQCGIATFSSDLCSSLTAEGHNLNIVAISDHGCNYHYSNQVIFNIRQNQRQDYLKAAAFINAAAADLVILQHEYGIFGGQDGEYVLQLIKLLHKPYILITHTVLPRPSKKQKQILNEACHRAAGIVCMTQRSRNLLIDLYEAPAEIVKVIAHGVPDFVPYAQPELKHQHGLQNHRLISTFGLIGPGKGLEIGLKAIAEVVTDHPDVIYLILGQTHPMLLQQEGEKYRQMLVELMEALGLQRNVLFINKFLSDEELGKYLYMTDIYLSPYPNLDQAVSGTMAFAIGCGRAIVSTAYAYAKEVLKGGRGLLVPNAEPHLLAQGLKKILESQELQKSLQEKAWELGKTWTWSNVGREYLVFFEQVLHLNRLGEEKILAKL